MTTPDKNIIAPKIEIRFEGDPWWFIPGALALFAALIAIEYLLP